MSLKITSCTRALALSALAALSMGLMTAPASADSCGKGKISKVAPATSTKSGLNQFWNVSPGSTVTITLSGVTDCANAGTDTTIQVIVMSSSSGNTCLTATKTATGTYVFTYNVPNGGCNTSVIKYCTTGCSTSTGFFAKDAAGSCMGHLRVGTSTGAACTPTISGCKDTDLGCLTADPTITCDNASTLGGYTVTGSTICGGVLPVSCTAGAVTGDNCNRSQTFTYAATNDCGQSAVCYAKFTWSVHTAPEFDNLPSGTDLGCNPATLPTCASVTAHDNCQTGIVATCTDGGVQTVGTCGRSETFHYKATNCANQSVEADVTYTWSVVSNPVFDNCPEDKDLGCNPSSIPGCDDTVTAHNECGSVPVTCDSSDSGPTDCNHYSRTITYTATDACSGLSATCVQKLTWTVVTVKITCPPDANVCKEDFLEGDTSFTGTATAVDNCGNPVDDSNIDFSDSAKTDITCPDGQAGFTFVRTWTVTVCGATDTCTQLITVCPCQQQCFPFGQGCTVTIGYWQTHGSGDCHKGNNSNDWPAGTITIGCQTYNTVTDAAAICGMLKSGPNVIRQLIGAQLNLLNGAKDGGAGIQAIIDAANACLCAGGDCTSFDAVLESYNSGKTGPGHCGTCP